jgi:hypothetical protein
MNQGPVVMPVTPMVRYLMIANVAVWFVIQIMVENIFKWPISSYGALVPGEVIYRFFIWQPFTYMFFHSTAAWSQ